MEGKERESYIGAKTGTGLETGEHGQGQRDGKWKATGKEEGEIEDRGQVQVQLRDHGQGQMDSAGTGRWTGTERQRQ